MANDNDPGTEAASPPPYASLASYKTREKFATAFFLLPALLIIAVFAYVSFCLTFGISSYYACEMATIACFLGFSEDQQEELTHEITVYGIAAWWKLRSI